MAALAIFAVKNKPAIGPIEITASILETHTRMAEITSSPIETGASISDHRRVHSDQLTIEGIISDAATTSKARVNADGEVIREPDNLQGFTVDESYQQLIELFEGADLFEVVTGLKIYRNMQFTRLVVNRDKATSAVIAFSADLQSLEFAQGLLVPLTLNDADKPKMSPKEEKGRKETKEAVKSKRKTSARKIFNAVKGP